MNNYKNHLLHVLFSICLLFTCSISNAQCNCQFNEYNNNCEEEKVIGGGTNGTNITDELYDAVMNYCKIRIANYSTDEISYFTFPQVFRDISHKEIILDPGVRLIGLPGSFSDCSQSVLTFDGNEVHDIVIRGNYCEGQIKPSIEMGETNYISYDDVGYLVGADDTGNPYLNDLGQLNYVFSDGDSDPYFDNNGIPNFITNPMQLQVEKDCEYNDYLCNRKIIVWCPYSWEARHIISLHGVENFWIENLLIANASGGDGIHITDDHDFNVSSEVQLKNLDFDFNARNGLKITNAFCVDLLNVDFNTNCNVAPLNLVTPEAAFNLDQNTSPGSVDDYMGTTPDYALHNISFESGFFQNNTNRDVSIDIPIGLTLCNEEAAIKASNICIFESDDAIVFERSNPDQGGVIKLNSVSIDEFDKTLIATEEWLSEVIVLGFDNWSVNKTSGPPNEFDITSSTFCFTATASDICKSSNILDDLCQPSNCVTPNYFCSPNPDPNCGGGGGVNCDFNVYTEVEEIIEYNCGCDYLFMIDESVSVSPDEWEEMNCSITNLMNELDSICVDSCDIRFALIQWAWTTQQHLARNFECLPFDFDRRFRGLTDVGDALQFLLALLNNEVLVPNEECFKVIIFTDAPCGGNSGWPTAGPTADLIKDSFNVEFIIVDYTYMGHLAECEPALDVIDDEDGNVDPNDIIQNEFDCDTGIGADNFIDTSYTYTIHVEIDAQCIDPTITWTAYAGGEILTISPDETTVTVNGVGYYTVEVLCASGCINSMFEYVIFDDQSLVSNNNNPVAIVKKDRIRYYEGKTYTPHEYEQLIMRGDLKTEIKDIQVLPNPVMDVLHIQVPEGTDDYNLTIFNTQGLKVYDSILKSDDDKMVDLGSLANGLYVVKILNTNTLKTTSHKVMKLSNE